MKLNSVMIVLLIGLMSLAGCASGPTKPGEGGANGAKNGQTQGQGADMGADISAYSLDDPNSPLAKRVIYFDFDSSNIGDDAKKLIELHAKYLADHPETSVVLEGHTDERGSREYNIALGERRAQAVKQIMLLYGVAESQIQTISFGEERPVAPGHDEAAWALNRRVEIVYSQK